MEHISEQCWTRIESLRHRMKSVCSEADKDELASVDAELIELREIVFASLGRTKPLFLLLHNPPDSGKVKVVGIYSSQMLAEAANERVRILPGFCDQPNCFNIERYDVDKDHWARGFVRL